MGGQSVLISAQSFRLTCSQHIFFQCPQGRFVFVGEEAMSEIKIYAWFWHISTWIYYTGYSGMLCCQIQQRFNNSLRSTLLADQNKTDK